MPPAGFEPTVSAGERPQTYALDRTATGTGIFICVQCHISEYRSLIRFYEALLRRGETNCNLHTKNHFRNVIVMEM